MAAAELVLCVREVREKRERQRKTYTACARAEGSNGSEKIKAAVAARTLYVPGRTGGADRRRDIVLRAGEMRRVRRDVDTCTATVTATHTHTHTHTWSSTGRVSRSTTEATTSSTASTAQSATVQIVPTLQGVEKAQCGWVVREEG